MQRIAAEMNFSETTFVFPPEGTGDVRMRIFTPGDRAAAGRASDDRDDVRAGARGRDRAGAGTFVFELGVGPIPVSLEWDDDGLSFAWMTQLLPSFGAQIADRGGFAAAVGLQPDDLEDLPIEAVSCGVRLPVRAGEDAGGGRPRGDLPSRPGARLRAGGSATTWRCSSSPIAPARGDETVYSRMLAPQFGIAEDPATGGASGPLGSYLLHHRVVSAAQARSMVSLQGVAMERPSRIHISIDSDGGTITRVSGRRPVGAGGGGNAPACDFAGSRFAGSRGRGALGPQRSDFESMGKHEESAC